MAVDRRRDALASLAGAERLHGLELETACYSLQYEMARRKFADDPDAFDDTKRESMEEWRVLLDRAGKLAADLELPPYQSSIAAGYQFSLTPVEKTIYQKTTARREQLLVNTAAQGGIPSSTTPDDGAAHTLSGGLEPAQPQGLQPPPAPSSLAWTRDDMFNRLSAVDIVTAMERVGGLRAAHAVLSDPFKDLAARAAQFGSIIDTSHQSVSDALDHISDLCAHELWMADNAAWFAADAGAGRNHRMLTALSNVKTKPGYLNVKLPELNPLTEDPLTDSGPFYLQTAVRYLSPSFLHADDIDAFSRMLNDVTPSCVKVAPARLFENMRESNMRGAFGPASVEVQRGLDTAFGVPSRPQPDPTPPLEVFRTHLRQVVALVFPIHMLHTANCEHWTFARVPVQGAAADARFPQEHSGPASSTDDYHSEPSAIVEYGDSYMSPAIQELNRPAQLPELISACLAAHYGLQVRRGRCFHSTLPPPPHCHLPSTRHHP